MASGFVAYKTIHRMECETCCSQFGSKSKDRKLTVCSETEQYMDELNRGGVTFPSDNLFTVIQSAYQIFNMKHISSVLN